MVANHSQPFLISLIFQERSSNNHAIIVASQWVVKHVLLHIQRGVKRIWSFLHRVDGAYGYMQK
jgi:hypothetical protein